MPKQQGNLRGCSLTNDDPLNPWPQAAIPEDEEEFSSSSSVTSLSIVQFHDQCPPVQCPNCPVPTHAMTEDEEELSPPLELHPCPSSNSMANVHLSNVHPPQDSMAEDEFSSFIFVLGIVSLVLGCDGEEFCFLLNCIP